MFVKQATTDRLLGMLVTLATAGALYLIQVRRRRRHSINRPANPRSPVHELNQKQYRLKAFIGGGRRRGGGGDRRRGKAAKKVSQ